jgi:negative regulator of sigma E activity
MSKFPDDEVLSAYLDGELTDTERDEVDAWLKSDPAAQRTLDELRAVRDLVVGLPRQTVGEDLATKVLQLAERRMLSETPAADDATAPQPLSTTAPQRRFLGRRALAWAGLAAAVALFFALSEKEKPGLQPVPQAPQVVERQPAQPAEPRREPPELRPMPGDNRGGIYAAKPQASPPQAVGAAEQPQILLVKCFVRVEAPRNVLDSLLARQRILRDDSERLINSAVDRLGLRSKQQAPRGLTAVGDPSYVYAEATPRQIEGVLEALASRTRDFPALVVEPGQKGQEAWRVYSRGVDAPAPAKRTEAPPTGDQKQPLLLVVQPVRVAAPKK